MMRAYDEIFTGRARSSLAGMLDHAVNILHIEAGEFIDLFIMSGMAALFARGDVRVLTGMSGSELACKVLDICGIEYEQALTRYTSGRSREYICGSILAAFQWETALPFEDIIAAMPVSSLISEYDRLHRAAVSSIPWQLTGEDRRKAMEELNEQHFSELTELLRERSHARGRDTRLKELRLLSGMSQSQLAATSGVPVRTIQQYEQRRKDINKAQFEYLVRLASALSCEPAQLLEL